METYPILAYVKGGPQFTAAESCCWGIRCGGAMREPRGKLWRSGMADCRVPQVRTEAGCCIWLAACRAALFCCLLAAMHTLAASWVRTLVASTDWSLCLYDCWLTVHIAYTGRWLLLNFVYTCTTSWVAAAHPHGGHGSTHVDTQADSQASQRRSREEHG
jgi:hypothetical protein